jgi:hypothetical protein
VQASGDLGGTWTAIQTWPAGTPPGTQTVTDPVPVSATGRRFIRLNVQGP